MIAKKLAQIMGKAKRKHAAKPTSFAAVAASASSSSSSSSTALVRRPESALEMMEDGDAAMAMDTSGGVHGGVSASDIIEAEVYDHIDYSDIAALFLEDPDNKEVL